jgi:hypothetical protein
MAAGMPRYSQGRMTGFVRFEDKILPPFSRVEEVRAQMEQAWMREDQLRDRYRAAVVAGQQAVREYLQELMGEIDYPWRRR